MESGFTDFVLEELRTLIEEINAAQQPSNLSLYENILRQLRPQYDQTKS